MKANNQTNINKFIFNKRESNITKYHTINGKNCYVYVWILFKMIIIENCVNWGLFTSNWKTIDNISANQRTNLS